MVNIGKKEATIIISIIGITLAFFTLVLSNRPIVDYRLALPKNYADNYELGDIINLEHYNPDIEVQSQVRNRGGIDACVNLIITLENASFTQKKPTDIFLENDTIRKIISKPQANQENYVFFTSFIIPNEECESFSIAYSLERRTSNDFFENIINHFLLGNPYSPIYIEFNRIDENSFERVK